MDQVARWNDATSSSGRRQSISVHYDPSSAIDIDLLTRIRSLLISRNDHYPPKTPYPSPDNSIASHYSDKNRSSYFPDNSETLGLNTFKIFAKLARLDSQKSSMITKGVDRLVGQMENPNLSGRRKCPSQPDMRSDLSTSVDGAAPQVLSGLDYKTVSPHVGREHRKSPELKVVIKPTPPKQAYGSRIPRYLLKTIPPASPQAVSDQLRPEVPHVLGSFSTVISPSSTSPSRMLDDGPPAMSSNTLNSPLQPESIASVTKNPSAPLDEEKIHSLLGQPSIESTYSKFLHSSPSKATLRSYASASQLENRLGASAQEDDAALLAQPLLKSNLRRRDSESDISRVPLSATGEYHGLRDVSLSQPMLIQAPRLEHVIDGSERLKHTGSVLSLKGPQISNLLAQLPPVRQVIVGDFDGQHLVAKSAPRLQDLLSTDSAPVEERNKPVSANEIDELHNQSLPLPNNIGTTGSAEDERPRSANARSIPRVYPEVDAPPSVISKLPTLSRAASALSMISSRLRLRTSSLSSMHKYGEYGIVSDENGLPRPPSLHSLGNSDNGIDEAKMNPLARQSGPLQKGFHPPLVTSEDDTRKDERETKLNWMQQILARRSTTSATPDNLTARPYHRLRLTVDAAATSSANTRPVGEGVGSVTNDNSVHHHLLGQDRSDEAFVIRQQQSNPESFAQVIHDLESVLEEALLIARQATDKDDNQSRSMLPAKTSKSMLNEIIHSPLLPHDLEKEFDDENDRLSSTSAELEERTRHAEHSQDHVIVVEPERESRYHGHFKNARRATPYPASSAVQTGNPSMIPPLNTGEAVGEKIVAPLYLSRMSKQALSEKDLALKTLILPWEQPLDEKAGDKEDTLPPIMSNGPTDTSDIIDWGSTVQRQATRSYHGVSSLPIEPQKPASTRRSPREQLSHVSRDYNPPATASSHERLHTSNDTSKSPVYGRASSADLRALTMPERETYSPKSSMDEFSESPSEDDTYLLGSGTSGPRDAAGIGQNYTGEPQGGTTLGPASGLPHQDTITALHRPDTQNQVPDQDQTLDSKGLSLRGRHHFSLRGHKGFSLSRTHRRAPIARDWTKSKKRYVASVTCINTALMGLIIGIYAGEVPAIQYAIVDEHHYAILGNVVLFIGLAISTALLWPLPLLHGRKPYILAALALLLPLQFPQAVAVGAYRSPYVATYRVALLLPRAIAGLVMGFVNINLKTTLLDLFGASLQSGNPHQETVNENDVRRHGGGMGIWLGVWTWCSICSIGVGFLIGAVIISGLDVSWGFWLTIILTAIVLILNVLTPEVRRSPYRRSMAEVRTGTDVSRRIARGEIKMHLHSTGPKWWWEEVFAGHVLCVRMLKQPGFAVLSLYLGWIYGQIIMIIVVSPEISSAFKLDLFDFATAARSFNIQILQVPATIRWPLRRRYPAWCFDCNSFPESFSFQPF